MVGALLIILNFGGGGWAHYCAQFSIFNLGGGGMGALLRIFLCLIWVGGDGRISAHFSNSVPQRRDTIVHFSRLFLNT